MATLERTLEQNDYTQTSENQAEQYADYNFLHHSACYFGGTIIIQLIYSEVEEEYKYMSHSV